MKNIVINFASLCFMLSFGLTSSQVYQLQPEKRASTDNYILLNVTTAIKTKLGDLPDVRNDEEEPMTVREIAERGNISLEFSGGEVSKAYLEAFTLCVDFKVEVFTPLPAILSYATLDNMMMLKICVIPRVLWILYDIYHVKIQAFIYPMMWYHVCLVGDAEGNLNVYLQNELIDQRPMNPIPKLWLDGILILGQDQDELGGTFPLGQIFRGRISQVFFWSRPLSREELLKTKNCESTILPGNIISWVSSPWEIYGEVNEVHENYCDELDKPVFFFQTAMPFKEALEKLEIYGMSLARPQTWKSLTHLSTRLEKSGSQCSTSFSSYRFGWITNSGHFQYFINNYSLPNDDTNNQCVDQSADFIHEPPMLLTSHEVIFSSLTCDSFCFFGEYLNSRSIFHLRGLCKNGKSPKTRLALEFVFSLNPNGDYFLAGLTGMSIQTGNESKWFLINNDDNSQIASTYCTTVPVGRMEWKAENSNLSLCDDSRMLVLSKCSYEEEFTCDDGSCINITSRCNMIPECNDWSDEKNCTRIKLPTAYMSDIPPKLPMDFSIAVDIYHVEVNLLKMTVSLELSIEIIWYEERISFKNLQPDPEANLILKQRGKDWPIWVPHTSISPATSYGSIDHQPSVMVQKATEGKSNGDDTIYPGAESPILYNLTQHPTLRCLFCLKRYPHDEQFCHFKIGITNVPLNSINIINKTLNFFGNTELSEYLVGQWNVSGSNHILQIDFQLKRRIDHELLSTYFPTFLLLLIAYGTLFIDSENFSERGSMSLTTMLVLISLYTESLSNLPTTSYNKEIDGWYLFVINYVSIIIFVHLATSRTVMKQTTSMVKPISTSRWFKNKGKACGLADYLSPKRVLRGARILFGIALPVFLTFYFWRQMGEYGDPCGSV
ncbi:uncharacterized protein [Palaemon carinicauda]|uniref:uncharacterized protein n=1 Tax=Palaemon carinicauda TaxID=392227 RepID=UPI0035B60B44